jgi:hypothetical protein
MLIKPDGIKDIWTELELCERFNLPANVKTGQSRVVGNWIKRGMPHTVIGRRRYFSEPDIVEFLFKGRGEE